MGISQYKSLEGCYGMKTLERHNYDGNNIIKTRKLVFEPYDFSEPNMCLVIGLIQQNLKPELLKRKKLKYNDGTNANKAKKNCHSSIILSP